LDRRLGVPQSRSGRGGEKKNSQPLPGLEPPITQPAAKRYTTEVSQLPAFRKEVYSLNRKRKREVIVTVSLNPLTLQIMTAVPISVIHEKFGAFRSSSAGF
jgi:hypothetical protein